MPDYRLKRSDGREDPMTQRFGTYNDAYDALERYCSSFCCSDDDRIDYSLSLSTATHGLLLIKSTDRFS